MNKALLTGACLLAAGAALHAQERYVDEVFDAVEVSDPIEYQQNYSFFPVLAGVSEEEVPVPKFFKAYTPVGDTATDRPVVILHTTGSYIPQFVAQGIYGTLDDSVMVEVATRFARRGFVALTAEYRQGWLPTAPEQNRRTASLLIASYKGVQDTRTLARFLQRSIAEEDNPYGISPDRIMHMGFGTGGYNVYNTAFLDDASDVTDLPRFFNEGTGDSFLDSTVYGNPTGLLAGSFNIPQHEGYDGEIAFSVGIGGAGGDLSWVDPSDNPTIGFHSTGDRNAPYAEGDVNVPVSATQSLFVIRVFGPRALIAEANAEGVNAPLDSVNARLAMEGDFLTLRSQELEDVAFTTRDDITTTFAVENFYPFQGSPNIANRYNWIDSAQLAARAEAYNATPGGQANPANVPVFLAQERMFNPNVTNPVAARAVIDTIMDFTLPRAFVALQLGNPDSAVSVVDLDAREVSFSMAPNPLVTQAVLTVANDVDLMLAAIYDGAGRRVAATRLSGHSSTLDRGNLPTGTYTLIVQTSAGVLAHRFVAN